MFPVYYEDSTSLVVTSSDGQLQKDYGLRWVQESLDLETENYQQPVKLHFAFHATVNTASKEISFITEGAWGDVLRRLVTLALITYMPEEGLEEALTCLREIFEFNIDKLQHRLIAPQMVRMGIGTVTSFSESPDLIISD